MEEQEDERRTKAARHQHTHIKPNFRETRRLGNRANPEAGEPSGTNGRRQAGAEEQGMGRGPVAGVSDVASNTRSQNERNLHVRTLG